MDIVGGEAATDGVGTDGSLLCSSDKTSHLSCCGDSVLRAIVGAVGGVISMLQTVDSPNITVISICKERDVAQR